LKRFRNHRADALVFNEAAYLGITTPHHRRTFMLRQAIRTKLCGFLIAASFQVAAETQRFPSEAGQVTVK